MRAAWSAFAALFLCVSSTLAGSNGGGTLLVHALDVVYTNDNSGYCEELLPRGCESIDSRIDGTSTHVWMVVAAFTEQNKPRLQGVEFGVSYSGVGIEDWGPCTDAEVPLPGWPASGTGTMVTWVAARTERFVPVYWFAGYTYAATEAAEFRVTPHPVNGGHFADSYIPAHLDEIAAYGRLGFGADGAVPCPTVQTIRVHPDGTGDRPTIQSAIDVAAPTSVIELEDGVYRGPGNRDIRTNDTYLTIRSLSGNPRLCVLDCEGDSTESHRGFEVRFNEKSSPLIEGITIANGYVGDDIPYDSEGGAVLLRENGALQMKNCIFENCSTNGNGGAIDTAGELTLEDCLFLGNSTRHGRGGAMRASGYHLTLRRCRFEGNTAAFAGGAIVGSEAVIVLDACVFSNNVAPDGGGAWFTVGQTTVSGCTWSGNQATRGGALFVAGGGLSIEQTTISDNASDAGTGVYFADPFMTAELRNTILSFGVGGEAFHCGTASVTARGCDIFGNDAQDWPSCLLGQSQINDNFSADPLYCDRANGNYYIDAHSPCSEGANSERGLVGAWPVGCGETSGTPEHGPLPRWKPVLGPNPFRSGTSVQLTLAWGSDPSAHVRVLDSAGRLVDEVPVLRRESTLEARWEGRDSSGRQVPAGVYFFHVSSSGNQIRVPVVCVR